MTSSSSITLVQNFISEGCYEQKENNKQLNTDDNNFWLQYAQQLENSKSMERNGKAMKRMITQLLRKNKNQM